MSQQQLQSIVEMLRSQPVVNPNASVEEARAGFEQVASMFLVDADIKREVVSAGGVKAEWVSAPDADAGRAVLYLHGGGYVIGSINTHRSLAARLSRASKARVLVIDYRLAPEHPHPAAVDDSVAAYRWMLTRGLKPARIAVAGDSAGGGLTVATLLAIRDAKLPLPGAGACLSPWVDLEGIGESMTTKAGVDPIVQKAGLLQMAAAYLGGKAPRTPLAAPLYADLSGLPPLLIQVGTAETLLDDASRLAERARKAGVTVSYEPWESMIHVWHLFAPMLDEGQQAIDRIGEFVRKQAA
jgi:monoterpene epsilon-lactone hydrolase